jgi:signal transduction histidine kinase
MVAYDEEMILGWLRRYGIETALAAVGVAALTTGRLYLFLLPLFALVAWSAAVRRPSAAVASLVAAVLVPIPLVATVDRFVLLALVATVVWGAAFARSAYREESRRRAHADLAAASARAVGEERLRIARDLHDMVAHGLSVITVQASYGALVGRQDPIRAVAALGVVEEVGRETLVQMRDLLTVLRTDPATPTAGTGDDALLLSPTPGVDALDDLIARTASAGLHVDLDLRGSLDDLPDNLGTSVHRIAQEGLTNVLKHADVDQARLLICRDATQVTVTITNDAAHVAGTSDPTHEPAYEPGHGLIGIRERVALHGGTVVAGPRPEGGYCVHVCLPCTPNPSPAPLGLDAHPAPGP